MGCGCSVHCAIVGHYSPGLKAYIFNKRGADPKDNQYPRLARKVHRDMKLYIDEAKSGDVLQKPGRHVMPGGHRCRVVHPKERTRIASITRQVNNTQLPELQHELFQWWVDLTQHLHARVATSAIMAQAELIRKDALEAEVVNPARVPKITRMWIARWRRYFSIVPRAITCTYKVSYQSKLNRMGVL